RLSPQQERLWWLQQTTAGHSPYRAQVAILIQGRLDSHLLRKSVEKVVDRHEILRTAFAIFSDGRPVQIISDCGIEWSAEHNRVGGDAEAQASEIEKILLKSLSVSIDLEKGPFLRASLVTLSHSTYLLILTSSALLMDASSFRNLAREISLTYQMSSA